MRPVIKPALRRLRRDKTTVQIGLDSRRAVVLTGQSAMHVLNALDGTRDRQQVLAHVHRAGVPEETAERVLDLLAERGMLDDETTHTESLRGLSLAERDRLRPDLASFSLLSASTDAGLTTLGRRRRATVQVHGAGRVGATIASLLAASGIGHVNPIDPDTARYTDATPGGLSCSDAGTRRDRAAAAALRRTAPATQDDHVTQPDLAILAPVDRADHKLPDALLREQIPHLIAIVQEANGVVGPLVVPESSACLRCQHLHRVDRDPAWPRLAAQLELPNVSTESCDTVLASAVATLAASQALAYLDDSDDPISTLNGALELSLPDLQWRRRSWPPHPRCGCRWNANH